MQIMPDTGRHVASMLGDVAYDHTDLTDPATSIRYGAWFLARLVERYDGRERVALAAYNGGPGNADRWLADARSDDDAFVEIIDFAETRRYVRRVLEALAQYERLSAADAASPGGR
jgi:soluble lytic murein transglycosylase